MSKRAFLQTFAYCFLITTVIAAGFILVDPLRWADHLIEAFSFSFAIGYAISFLVNRFERQFRARHPFVRASGLLALFLIGGTIGTAVAYALLTAALGMHIQPWWPLFLVNLVLSAVFGTTAVVYFSLRARTEKLAVELKAREIAEEKLVRLKTEAELAALQAKVDPHFLFNTLNSIASLISDNPAGAESTIEKLSNLFRYTLHHSATATVRLHEELEIVRAYLEIETIRFGKRLHFDIRAEETLSNFDVPAFLIQPLVENSIKHVIAKSVQGGSISIAVFRRDGMCVIGVRDSGPGFIEMPSDTGFGLKGIRERLRLMYGDKGALQIGQPPTSEIQILIPLG